MALSFCSLLLNETAKRFLIDDKIPLAKIFLENEMAISGRSEQQIYEFLDSVAEVMMRLVDTGLRAESVLPGPIKLHSKAAAIMRNLSTSAKGPAARKWFPTQPSRRSNIISE